MKKSLFTLIALLSLLVLTTTSVFAAPLSDSEDYLVLREVRNDPHGGVIFVFDVYGEFSKKDFRGSFLTFGEDNKIPVDCNLQSPVLQCTTSQITAGRYVNLHIGGFLFWARVPEKGPIETQPVEPTEYCYPVLDLNDEDDWEQFDTYCQDTPASYGDQLIYFSEVIFELMPSSPFCSEAHIEDAFYRYLFCES